MGKLRPAPRGFAVQKDAGFGLWYIERRETNERGAVLNIQAVRDDDGVVMFFGRRSQAITQALIQAQNDENEQLRARLAQLEMQLNKAPSLERSRAVS